MANLRLIKELLRKKNVTIRDFSKSIGITEQGLQKLIRDNSTKIETLEAIARKLNVPIDVFFDLDLRTNQDVAAVETKISTVDLFMIIQVLTETIRSQQQTIEVLSCSSKNPQSA